MLERTAPGPWLAWWPHAPDQAIMSSRPWPAGNGNPVSSLGVWSRHDAGLMALLDQLVSEGIGFVHHIHDRQGQSWRIEGSSPDGPHPRWRQKACLLWAQSETTIADQMDHVPGDPAHPILDHLSTGVALFDQQLMITSGNRSWWRLIGIPRPERLPIPLAVVLMESRDRHIMAVGVDFARFYQDMADWLNRADEKPLDLHLANGQVLRWTAFGRHGNGPMLRVKDITEQMELTRSLAAMGAVQRQSLDHMRDGIMVIGTDGRLRYHNPALADLLGMAIGDMPAAGELLTGWIVRLRSYFFDTRTADEACGLLMSPPPGQGIWRLQQGRILDVQNVRLPDGSCMMCFTDVTAREKAALSLRQIAIDQADQHRMRTEMWAGLACRLRTPLTSVLGYAEAVRAGYFGDLVPAQIQALDHLVSASHALHMITERIIDSAALEAGLTHLKPDVDDFRDVVRDVRDDLCHRHPSAKIDLTLPTAKLPVLCDAGRMRGALTDICEDLLEQKNTLISLILHENNDRADLLITTDVGSFTSTLITSMVRTILNLHHGDINISSDQMWTITLPIT